MKAPPGQRSTERRLTWADALRIGLVGLLGALIGIGMGNAVGTSVGLGPLDLTTRLTVGVGSTFDVGVAAVRLNTAGPAGLSVTAHDLRTSGPTDLADSLTAFSDVGGVAASLLSDTMAHLAGFASIGALLGLLLGLVTHRRVLGHRTSERGRRAVYVAGTWLAVGTLATAIIGPSVDLARRTWTPVVGLSVEGQMLPDVQVSGTLLDETVRALERNENFYQELQLNTASAMEGIAEADAERGLSAFVLESDLHCNLGMTRVISEVAAGSGANFVLSAGDITMSGSQLEALCTEVYLRRLGGTPLVLVLGNHDSDQTGADLEAAGATVLHYEPVEIAGLTLLGDSDPQRSQIGSPTVLRDSETTQEFTDRTTETACDTESDVLVVHNPAHAQGAVEAGCAPLILSGHRHHEEGPTVTGDTVGYTVDNSGGTGENTLSYGPLATDSAVALFYYRPDTGVVIGFRTVQFGTDGAVEAGDYRLLNPGKLDRGR